MSDIVPSDQIEAIVGAKRHPRHHIGRAASAEQTVYILHSQRCKDSGIDLRECAWSVALDRGIDGDPLWDDCQDRPVLLHIHHGALMPITVSWLEATDD